MTSKIATSHARIAKLWTATDRFWKDTNDEKRKKLIEFQNAVLATLSCYVTDEEWNQALQAGADSLRISERKGNQ